LIQRKSSFIINRCHSAIVEAYIIFKFTAEEVIQDRRSFTAYRVYVTSTGGGDYCKVGWVLMDSVPACMICQTAFGLLIAGKHNCLACGDVICAKCSPTKAEIAELRSEEMHRICSTCQANNAVEVSAGRPLSISPSKRSSVTPDKVSGAPAPPTAPVVIENAIRSSKAYNKPVIVETNDGDNDGDALLPQPPASSYDTNRPTEETSGNLDNVTMPVSNMHPVTEEQAEVYVGEDEEEGEEHPIVRDLAESLDELQQSDNSFAEPITLASSTDDEDDGGDTFTAAEDTGETDNNEEWLQNVLSSDGETVVIPVKRLSHFDQSAFANKGYIAEGSEYAFVPRWKVQLRRVQAAQKKEVSRAPSAKELVRLRPVAKKK
jgi:hypothetical protein